MFVHLFQINLNFLYVCQSVSWLTSLRKLDKYRDISSSGSDIFLKFLGGIPGMLVHLSQIILNFLRVFQSVSLLTSLLILDQYRDISHFNEIHFWIFLRYSWDVGSLVPNSYDLFVCLSVCYLAHFLTEITQILGYLQIWIRYLSEIFWRHSWDVGTLVPNNSEFLVSLSVC